MKTTKNILRLFTILVILAFATRLAIGLTVNERYEDAIETLDKHGVLRIEENGTVLFTTPYELEKETVRALNEVGKRHYIHLFTV